MVSSTLSGPTALLACQVSLPVCRRKVQGTNIDKHLTLARYTPQSELGFEYLKRRRFWTERSLMRSEARSTMATTMKRGMVDRTRMNRRFCTVFERSNRLQTDTPLSTRWR